MILSHEAHVNLPSSLSKLMYASMIDSGQSLTELSALCKTLLQCLLSPYVLKNIKILNLKVPIMTASRRFAWNIMPYLLF